MDPRCHGWPGARAWSLAVQALLWLGGSCLVCALSVQGPALRTAAAQPLPQGAAPMPPQGLPQAPAPGLPANPPLGGLLDAAKLERLVAPVALFDDELLLDTLDASLHPVQVLQARRLAREGSGQASPTWAPSVRELLRLPRVLDMLADHPAWAEALGRAYDQQGPELMDAVQRLRWRALDAGTLDPTDQRVVDIADGIISIHAVAWMAVPQYDPWCVYGPWSSGAMQGFDYQPFAPDCGFTAGQALVLVEPVPLLAGRWVWGAIDWRGRRVRVDRDQWRRHAPGHALPPSWGPRPPRAPEQPLQPRPPAPPPGSPLEPLRRGPGLRMPAPSQPQAPRPASPLPRPQGVPAPQAAPSPPSPPPPPLPARPPRPDERPRFPAPAPRMQQQGPQPGQRQAPQWQRQQPPPGPQPPQQQQQQRQPPGPQPQQQQQLQQRQPGPQRQQRGPRDAEPG